MSDIELVIKIDANIANGIIYGHGDEPRNIVRSFQATIADAIKNGTPLPKGHGDLKDANKLKHAFISWSMAVQGYFTDADIASIVCNSPTIIEADKEEGD